MRSFNSSFGEESHHGEYNQTNRSASYFLTISEIKLCATDPAEPMASSPARRLLPLLLAAGHGDEEVLSSHRSKENLSLKSYASPFFYLAAPLFDAGGAC